MDADGNKGDVLEAVSNPANISDMIHFIPHFKILFKLAQLGMMLIKEESLTNKVATAKRRMEQYSSELEAQEHIVEHLSFYELIEAEVQRAEE